MVEVRVEGIKEKKSSDKGRWMRERKRKVKEGQIGVWKRKGEEGRVEERLYILSGGQRLRDRILFLTAFIFLQFALTFSPRRL